MRLIDADAIKLEKGFFENIDNVPKFFEWLGKQPTIDPVKWIPVSERLPEEAVQVLVTDDAGGFATIDVDYGYFDKEYGRFEWFHSQNVTAWMPLPEPWKGEEDKMNQKSCRKCPHLDFNEMTDEMYCKLKDFELIQLRWYKHRPEWCPLVTVERRGEKNEGQK